MDDMERFVESILNRDGVFTDFEKQVYGELLKIPIGETVTYKELAERCGRPKASRAVGNALNKNPYPVFIPCHRVVSADGIGGYSKGHGLKKKLLLLEKKIKERICP